MAQHRSKEFWARHVAALRRSGLTRAAYCRRNGLSYASLTAWEHRLRASAPQPRRAAPALVPVVVEAPPSNGVPLVEIRIGTQLIVSVPAAVDAQWLGALLRAAGSC